MSPVLALILQYLSLAAPLIILALWLFNKVFDYFHPTGPEEIARREAERVAKQATKEFKQRQRLRSVRYWNS